MQTKGKNNVLSFSFVDRSLTSRRLVRSTVSLILQVQLESCKQELSEKVSLLAEASQALDTLEHQVPNIVEFLVFVEFYPRNEDSGQL